MVGAIETARRVARQALESTYCDKCSINEKVKNKVEGVTSFSDQIVISEQPCKISFESIPTANESDTVAPIQQSVKLFIAPELDIKPGSRIDITHLGVTTFYKRSGKPAVYHTHQEVVLELWKENA